MALTLNELYHSTGSKYGLKLVAGEKGLPHIMNWVYISEDINTAEFLQGGELVITTGVSSAGADSWLYDFILNMIAHNTCGLIVNTGVYLQPESITDAIIALCEQNDFPLFTMPWEIRIYDITKDYYNRIFLETQTDTAITNAFLSVIRHDSDYAKSITVLEDSGFCVSDEYCICAINSASADVSNSSGSFLSASQLLFSIRSYINDSKLRCHIATTHNTLLLICRSENANRIQEAMQAIQGKLHFYFSERSFLIGIGSSVSSMTRLKAGYLQALAAVAMAKYQKKSTCSFNDMGFFRLLFSVNDTSLLDTYVREHLGALLDYDKNHNSNYTETLHQYLMNDGSIQAIADTMFCHRNTINYRVHSLKESFGFDLDSAQVRFDLLTSFLIREYLSMDINQ